MELRSKIKELAEERGFKRPEDLSKKTELTRSTLYNVWDGDIGSRQYKTMLIIARVLGVSMEDLAESNENSS